MSVSRERNEMKQSWEEKLDEQGRMLIEAQAKLRRIRQPTSLHSNDLWRWIKEQNSVLSAYPELDRKKKVKLSPEFVRLFLRAHPEIELNEEQLQQLFEQEEFLLLRAEELELTQRIALTLEADQNKRMEAYEALASAI